MGMNKQTSKNIPFLDGLKGLSILAIIIYYMFQYALPGGYIAVNLFLFLAGFFNIRHFYLADLEGKQIKAGPFYKRRLSRLFFPLLAMVLITAAIVMVFGRDLFFNLTQMGLSGLFFVNNYYQIFNQQSYFEQAANLSIYTHLWYVSLYAQLVLLTPLLMRLFYRWHRRADIAINMFLITSIVSAALMAYWYIRGNGDPSRVYYDVLTRMFAFTLGGATGLFLPKNLTNSKRLKLGSEIALNLLSTVAMISMLLMAKFMYGTQPFAYKYGMLLFTLASMIFVLFTIYPHNWWNQLLSWKPLVKIGQRSYSYYLWFYPIYMLTPVLFPFLNKHLALHIIVQFLLIAGIGEASYLIFEKKKWSLPIGQDFNLRKARYQWKYLMDHPQELRGIKIGTIAYMIFAVVGGVAIIAAPESRGNVAKELQEVIEHNQQIAKDSSQEETQSESGRAPINYIEGLDQQVSLHANALEATFIGDSILISSMEQIQTIFPNSGVDGAIGRQLYESTDVIHSLNNQGLLNPTVVVLLGSNGTFSQGQLNDFITSIGDDHEIFFVNLNLDRPWNSDVNNRLQKASDQYGYVKLIDWQAHSTGHGEWFYEDKIHPNKEGALELAKFIAEEIYRQR